MFPSTTTKPSNQKQNHFKKKKKKKNPLTKPSEPITTPCRSAKTTDVPRSPPQTHSIFTHKQNKYPLNPLRHATPIPIRDPSRSSTLINAHASPRHHQTTTHSTTTIHHQNSAPNPRPKSNSKPITTHNQIRGAPLVLTHRLMIMVELR